MNSNWKKILQTNFTCVKELADFLELKEEERRLLLQNPRFVLNVPRRLAAKMQKGTLNDPLARQFIPHILEQEEETAYSADPNGENSLYQIAPKMLKKYTGRVLLLPTSACAMHCRYCFRQNFPYETIEKTLDEELQKIRSDPSTFEVILSGGDPLSLPDHKLFAILEELGKIPHVRVIRFHTRFPIGIPERIDEAFLSHLALIKKQIVFVIHINHPKELDDDVAMALKKLAKLGLPLFCQSVLLKDVNDSVEVLSALCERLVESGITPYYLHQLDQVKGASRFAVDQSKGIALIEKLMERLPGYAVPRYVKEIPGMLSKTPLI